MPRGASAARVAWMLVAAGPALAQPLPLPSGAAMTLEESERQGRYAMPIETWSPQGLPTTVIEGPLSARAWRVPNTGLTPQQLILPLREALEAAGWSVVLDCAGSECGGFDFRYATRVLDGPAMYVDLTRYRFVSALSPDGAGVSLLTSHDGTNGYVQVIRAGIGSSEVTTTRAAAEPVPSEPARDNIRPPARGRDAPTAAAEDTGQARAPVDGLGGRLEADGHAILPDVVFASGSASLGEGPVPALDALAEWLSARPGTRILIVGHTDATGSLEGNRALSEERARAVEAYLVERHATDPVQIEADGAGYLAPIASNLTESGRRANRRVEAVVLPD